MAQSKPQDSIKKTLLNKEAKLKAASASAIKNVADDAATLKKRSIDPNVKKILDREANKTRTAGRPGKIKNVNPDFGGFSFFLEEIDGENLIRVRRFGNAASTSTGYRAIISPETPAATGEIQILEDGTAMRGNDEFRLYTTDSNSIKVGYVDSDRFIPLKKAHEIGENRWRFFNDDDLAPRIIIEMSDNNTVLTGMK